MSYWHPYNDSESVGQAGSEGGKILRDEEHSHGARLTLEEVRDDRWTITCGIYGWMVHTRFFASEASAEIGFDETKRELGKILELIPLEDEVDDHQMGTAQAAIEEFVEQYQ